MPGIFNATYVGQGGNGASVGNVNDPLKVYTSKPGNTTILLRDNAGGQYLNSAFLNFGGGLGLVEGGKRCSVSLTLCDTNTDCPATETCVLEDETSAERAETAYALGDAPTAAGGGKSIGSVPSGNCGGDPTIGCTSDAACGVNAPCVFHYLDRGPDVDFELQFDNNTFWCYGTPDPDTDGTPDFPREPTISSTLGGGSRQHHDPGYFPVRNSYETCASALPIRELIRGTGVLLAPDPVETIDPRPIPAGSLVTSPTSQAPSDGFYEFAPYRGAFLGVNWATEWSNTSRLGLMPFCGGSGAGPGAGPTPDEVENVRFPDRDGLVWDEARRPGNMGLQYYDVLRTTGTTSAGAATFAGATCVETSDEDLAAGDTTTPPPGGLLFYLVRTVNDCGDGLLGFQSGGTARAGATCP
jgi:hypothetical protein